ncbi:TPA: hypothetical protein ACNTVZ_003869, partial [Escherichia coli]
ILSHHNHIFTYLRKNPGHRAGFSFVPSSHKPFEKPPHPPFSYRYAIQVTKLILFAIKQLISKHINQ